MRRRALLLATLVAVCVGAAPEVARAQSTSVDLWRISEVVTALEGDPQAQYIELTHPNDGCFFQSSRLEAFFADGSPIGIQMPWSASICATARTYLIATPQATARLGFAADRVLELGLPPAAGQACFRSSTVRYDCVRWGQIAAPIHDLSGPSDDTSASPAPPMYSLTRVSDTNVIANDFISYIPSPGVLNPVVRDGDAGLTGGPDAGIPDASFADVYIPDAAADSGAHDAAAEADAAAQDRDAGPQDAREHDVAPPGTDFEAGGGGCGCRTGGGGPVAGGLGPLVGLGLGLLLVGLRRRR